MMKRTTRAFALLCVLLLAFTAYADVLAVPNGITTIESEAFSGTAKADAVFIPASATEIAPDAFGSANFTVYGLPGTAAESFAKETGRQFVSVEITNIQLETDAWHALRADGVSHSAQGLVLQMIESFPEYCSVSSRVCQSSERRLRRDVCLTA